MILDTIFLLIYLHARCLLAVRSLFPVTGRARSRGGSSCSEIPQAPRNYIVRTYSFKGFVYRYLKA